MAASHLPQEMILAIIDHLHDDKPTLRACSLVCKAWTHPARLHLFASLVLASKWPLQPVVFPYVRHLELRYYLFCDEAPTWEQVIPLLVGFHRIISLTLNLAWYDLDVINAQTWSALSKNFSGIVSLSLTQIRVNQVSCVFPCRRELCIRDGGSFVPSTSTEASVTMLRLPPNLDTLELKDVEFQVILEWLLSLPILPALRTLRLFDIEDEDIDVFHRLIGVLGNDLESLSLSADIGWTNHSIDITPLTQLRSIEFLVDRHRNQNRWVTQTLSCISSARLEEVTFKIDCRYPDDIDSILEWSSVDAVLQHSTFSRLKNLYCWWLNHSLAPTSIIIRNLPQCTARKILHIGRCKPS